MEILDKYTAYSKIMTFKTDGGASLELSVYELCSGTQDSMRISFEYVGALIRDVDSNRLGLFTEEGYFEIKTVEDLKDEYIFV